MKITFQFKCVFGICRDLFYWHLWHVIEQARECGIDIQELPKLGSENVHVILKKKTPTYFIKSEQHFMVKSEYLRGYCLFHWFSAGDGFAPLWILGKHVEKLVTEGGCATGT